MRLVSGTSSLAVLTLAGALACHEPTTQSDSTESLQPPAFSLTSGSCNPPGTDPTGDEWNRNWNCGVWLRPSFSGFIPSDTQTVHNSAASWDGVLQSVSLNLPRFGSGSPTQSIPVSKGSDDAGATGWCGTSAKTPPYGVTLRRCTNGGTSTLGAVAIQELSHVLGFSDKWDTAVGADSAVGHCSGRSYNGQVTGTICQHEIETMYRGYGIRTASLNYDKHIVTGITVPQSVTIPLNGSAQLSVTQLKFARGNGTLCNLTTKQMCGGEAARAVTASNASFTWNETSSLISLTQGANSSIYTIHAGSAPGTATIQIGLSSSVYNTSSAFGDPGTGATIQVTVGIPPAGPPTNVTVSGVAATSAVVSWTNGDNLASTILHYRIFGQSVWSTASGGPLPPGQSSYTLTGLSCATAYSIEVLHVRDGYSTTAVMNSFTTTPCTVSATIVAPSAFHQTSCTPSAVGGKSYAAYALAWTAGPNPATSVYQVGTSLSNNSAVASIQQTGRITVTSMTVGPYLVTSTASPRYFWVRHANGALASGWVALQGNPIQVKNGCD